MFVPLREKYIFSAESICSEISEILSIWTIRIQGDSYAFKVFFYLNNGLFEFRVKATKNHIQFLLWNVIIKFLSINFLEPLALLR